VLRHASHESLQRGIEVIEFASGVPHLLKGEDAEDVAS